MAEAMGQLILMHLPGDKVQFKINIIEGDGSLIEGQPVLMPLLEAHSVAHEILGWKEESDG